MCFNYNELKMSVNIGNVKDPFYRYTRPVSVVTHKSGKTTITNLLEIAKALQTNSLYILHYIKLKKSVAVTSSGDIKSVIHQKDIEELINEFIDKYILCSKCNLPETIIKSTDKKKLYFCCNACGNVINIPENKFTKIIYKDKLK